MKFPNPLIFLSIPLLFTIVIGGMILASKSPKRELVSQGTKESCIFGANQAKEAFEGTRFEKWNFYETCILNIVCANPEKTCPVERIHQESAFFLNGD